MRSIITKVCMSTVLLTIGLYQSSFAQIDITPFVGWQFGSKARFFEGEINLTSNVNYGVVADIAIHDGMQLELYYSRSQMDAEWRPFSPIYVNLLPRNFKVDIHYFQVGGLKYIQRGNIEPFGVFTLGAVWFDGYEENITMDNLVDVTRFAISLGGGVRVFVSEKVGLRLQARMLLPMYFNGVGLWAGGGTGGVGGGVSVSTSIPIVQGDLTAGLTFRLGG